MREKEFSTKKRKKKKKTRTFCFFYFDLKRICVNFDNFALLFGRWDLAQPCCFAEARQFVGMSTMLGGTVNNMFSLMRDLQLSLDTRHLHKPHTIAGTDFSSCIS